MALYSTLGLFLYLQKGKYLIGPFLLLYALGYGTVAFASLKEAWVRRRHASAPQTTTDPVPSSESVGVEVAEAIEAPTASGTVA